MQITTLEIAGFGSALEALRLPFGKDRRSNFLCEIDADAKSVLEGYTTEGGTITANLEVLPIIDVHSTIVVDPKDLKLMQTLVKRGDEHAKVVRGIIVYARITAPIYLWAEIETYRAGHERLSSESTMHIDCKGLSGEELVKAKAAIPMGKELTKVDMFSYQALRNICRQRKGHRLPEWAEFIEWVKTLPLANELIFTEDGE